MNLFPGRDNKPDWNDPDIRSINALSNNGCLIPFPTYKKCFDAVSDYRRYLSDYVHLLNEGWEQRKYDHVYDLPEKILWPHDNSEKINLPCFFDSDFNRKTIAAIPYADIHQPVTLLAKNCTLPHYWSSLRKKITFAGIACAFHLFVNGRPAGYSDTRHTPISFDITSFWHEGENEIILLLYSSAASDHLRSGWPERISGILSDIYIEAFPAIYLSDVNLNCEPLNSDHTKWSFSIVAELSSCRISLESPSVRFDLYDDYKLLTTKEINAVLQPLTDSSRQQDTVKTISNIEFTCNLDEIKPWSADQPSVYDLYITISDNRGYEQVSYHMPVGFRKIERRGSGFLLNGKPLILTTANTVRSYEVSSSTTVNIADKYSTTVEKISDKLINIKKSGCNSLYLSDGIEDPAVFELADMLGLFIIVSTDISLDNYSEAELIGKWPVKTETDHWTNIMNDVITDLINSAKTHCSVIAWNVGHNLSSWPQLDKLLKTCASIDRSRLIMVPACECPDRDHPSVYFTSTGLKAIITDNLRSIYAYKDLNLPVYYSSTELCQLSEADSDVLYLQKTGELPIFGSYLLDYTRNDATVPAFLRNTASLNDICASIDTEQTGLILSNLHPFASMNNIVIYWQSHDTQSCQKDGTIELEILNADSKKYIELDEILNGSQKPSHLNVKISWIDNSWPHQGQRRTVCLTLPLSQQAHRSLIEPPSGRYTVLSHGRVRLEQDRHLLLISGSRFWFIFNRITGSFESWRCGETELLCSVDETIGAGPYWQIVPSNVQNDTFDICANHVEKIMFDCDGTGAVIEAKHVLIDTKRNIFDVAVRYEISQKGDLKISAGIEYCNSYFSLNKLNSVSVELILNLSRHMNQIQWYGYGPTAIDNATIDNMLPLPTHPHINNWLRIHSELVTAESQSWYGAHWLYAGNKQGLGLLIKSDIPFSFASSLLAADVKNYDSTKFFSRHYGQLRLEFSELIGNIDHEEIDNSLVDNSITKINNQKGQSISVIKRQYILQPSALNFI